MPGRAAREARNEKIEQDFKEGRTVEEIAAGCYLTPGYVTILLKGKGVDVPPKERKPRPHSKRNLEIVEAYRAGGSLRSIAADQGMTKQRVQQILVAAGQERRPQGAPEPEGPTTIVRTCEVCGKDFERPIKWRPAKPSRTCSPKCAGVLTRDESSGGAKAYRARQGGLKWREIAENLRITSGTIACNMARLYAVRRGLEWPLHRPRS